MKKSGRKVRSSGLTVGNEKEAAIVAPYLLVDGPEEVDLICETLQLGLQLHLIHVGLIHILLDEDKVVLTLCALVDFIFISGKT